MTVRLEWLGTATFRLTVDDLVIFLDAYLDRLASAPRIGLTAREVDRADYVLVGHSHFDHLAGAEIIAANTGATIIGSNETARIMLENGVGHDRLLRVQGGEHHRLGDGVTVRVYPSLHSCIWTSNTGRDPAQVCLGEHGLTEDERWPQGRADIQLGDADPELQEAAEHARMAVGSTETGGALVFMIDTPDGSIFYQDTSGCWTSIVSDLRPDVALVAMAGRPNVDGEPIQGSLAQYVGRMAALLRPSRLFLNHHDAWLPPRTPDMTGPQALAMVREELGQVAPRTELASVGYLEATRLFG